MNSQKTFPFYWHKAKKMLIQKDAKLAQLIQKYSDSMTLFSYKDPFYTFCKIIIGQQISVQAANAIFKRFNTLLNTQISTINFLNTHQDDVLACGFSKSKYRYLHGIADTILNSSFLADYQALTNVSMKEKKLLSLLGIGQWSADMFLIFHDLEPDVCPLGDVGLLNAIKKHYQVQSNEEILKICKNWKPYSSVATWYLWRDIDDDVVAY